MKPAVLAGALLLAACASSAPAATPVADADPADGMLCGPRANIIAALTVQFGEAPVGFGLNDDGFVLELYAQPGGETWTAVLTRPDGLSCLMMTGTSWLRPQARPGRQS